MKFLSLATLIVAASAKLQTLSTVVCTTGNSVWPDDLVVPPTLPAPSTTLFIDVTDLPVEAVSRQAYVTASINMSPSQTGQLEFVQSSKYDTYFNKRTIIDYSSGNLTLLHDRNVATLPNHRIQKILSEAQSKGYLVAPEQIFSVGDLRFANATLNLEFSHIPGEAYEVPLMVQIDCYTNTEKQRAANADLASVPITLDVVPSLQFTGKPSLAPSERVELRGIACEYNKTMVALEYTYLNVPSADAYVDKFAHFVLSHGDVPQLGLNATIVEEFVRPLYYGAYAKQFELDSSVAQIATVSPTKHIDLTLNVTLYDSMDDAESKLNAIGSAQREIRVYTDLHQAPEPQLADWAGAKFSSQPRGKAANLFDFGQAEMIARSNWAQSSEAWMYSDASYKSAVELPRMQQEVDSSCRVPRVIYSTASQQVKGGSMLFAWHKFAHMPEAQPLQVSASAKSGLSVPQHYQQMNITDIFQSYEVYPGADRSALHARKSGEALEETMHALGMDAGSETVTLSSELTVEQLRAKEECQRSCCLHSARLSLTYGFRDLVDADVVLAGPCEPARVGDEFPLRPRRVPLEQHHASDGTPQLMLNLPFDSYNNMSQIAVVLSGNPAEPETMKAEGVVKMAFPELLTTYTPLRFPGVPTDTSAAVASLPSALLLVLAAVLLA